MLFTGLFLITHGIYNKKVEEIKKNSKIKYKFIPRTLYEEQLSDPDIFHKFGGMFNTTSQNLQ